MWFTISENFLKHSIATRKNGIVTRITEQLADLNGRIQAAAGRAGRDPGCIRILAVSKKHSSESVEEARKAGLRHFGESYVQEALAKIRGSAEDTVWHFIGRIQSNKIHRIVDNFDWVHTVSAARTAERLSVHRPQKSGDLQVCIQIEPLGGEERGGIPEERVPGLANLIRELPRINLRGLMMMPLPGLTEDRTRAEYARTRLLLHELQNSGHEMDTLSMGMSADLEAAIMEGSTILRIGTALFGPRKHD